MGSIGGVGKNRGHVLVLPIPHPGHLSPMLRFATEIARRGTAITFVIYEDTLAGLASKGIVHDLEALDFRFLGVSNHWGPTDNIPVNDSRKLEESFKPELEKLLHDQRNGVRGPTTIVADMFLTWTQVISLS
jgi:UDP:flavonoid glycosyltransferase YjiC (YdhE family)